MKGQADVYVLWLLLKLYVKAYFQNVIIFHFSWTEICMPVFYNHINLQYARVINMIILYKQHRWNPVKLKSVFNYLLFCLIQYIYIYAHISAAVLCLWQHTCMMSVQRDLVSHSVRSLSNICTGLCRRNAVEIQEFLDASQELCMCSNSDQLLFVFLFQ